MAFQYAHHRPLTPITPIHSPHPSAGSSVRARTPGQLSLHEYRKMQVTPSPPAIPGQKTIKKKRGMSSLSRSEGSHAQSPRSNFFSSFASLTTPPETPSLEPPLGFTSNVLPVDAPTVSHTHQDFAGATYSEFAHLLSLGSELQHSPPQHSPSLPSLSSASRPLQSTSPYQPTTPQNTADFGLPSSRPLKHPLLGSQRSLRRPWSSAEGQDHRYVSLHSEAPARPRSHQQSRVESKRATSSNSKQIVGFETFQRPSILGSPPSGTFDRETLAGVGQQRNTWNPQNNFVKEVTRASRVATRNSQTELGIVNRSENLSGPPRPRELYFNSIKRLPRPVSTTKRRPAPLRLATSNTDGFYQSDDYTTSTSTFSLSKYPFPHPPQQRQPLLPVSPQASPPHTVKSERNLPTIPAESPLVRFSGISFEIVNPHTSLELAEFDTASDEIDEAQRPSTQLVDYDSDESEMGPKDGKKLPLAKRYSSFQNAYESVTHQEPSGSNHRSRRGSSATRPQPATPATPARPSTAPGDITPANTPPWAGFDEHGQRVNEIGEVVTGSIQAGPGASQADLTRARSLSATRSPETFQRSLEYPSEPAYTSNVPLPTQLQSDGPDLSGSSSSASPIQIPPLLPSFQHELVSPQEGRVGVVRSDTVHHSPQQAHTSGSRAITIDNAEPAHTNFSLPYRNRLPPSESVEPISRLPGVDLQSPEIFHPGENRHALPRTAPRESSPLRQTLYESDFESHSIAGDNTNVPPGRATGETRYSQATSVDDYYAESTFRRSEPFQYEHYQSRGTGQSSTISRFIQEYDYKSEVASDEGDDLGEPMSLPSRLEPSSTEGTLQAPPVPRRLALTNVTHANGQMNGHNTTTTLSTALRASYPRLRGMIVREMPVEDFETPEDFDEAIEDMEHQPLFHQNDSGYLERYQALMNRIEEIRRIDARQAAERRLNHVIPAPRSAFHHSEPRPEDYDEQDELYRSLQSGLHHAQNFQSTPAEGELEQEDHHRPGNMFQRQYSSRFRHSREFYRFIEADDDDDTSIEQYEGQTPQSPLDNNPLATRTDLLWPVRATQDDSQDLNVSRATGQDAEEDGQLMDNRSSVGAFRYGRSGPPPRGPPPGPSNGSQFAGMATIPPLNFTSRNPFEQSEVSSYDNTGRLLGISATAPMLSGHRGAVGPAGTNQTGTISKSPTSPYGLYKDSRTFDPNTQIPKVWSNHSPPGSSSLKHKSEVSAMASSSPSQTSNDVAAALEDEDEWETDITRSNRNSTMAEYWTFPEAMRKSTRSTASYTPAQLTRPTDSNLPGFYPAEDLSPEPHDDFEDITIPPRAVVRQGHKAQSTKSLARFERKPESSMTPARHGHSSADIELGVLSPQHNLSMHSNRSSRSATTSRWQRSSVLHQNSMRPLLLGSRAHIFDKPPTLHKRIHEMTPREVRLAHAINWFCVTIGAIIPLPSFLFCIGTFDSYTKGLTSHKMKRIAKVETAVFFSIIIIIATIYLTLSHQEEVRASGRSS